VLKIQPITDFKGIKKYYCSLHNCYHFKQYNYTINENGKRTKLKNTPFFRCKNYAKQLSNTEIFNLKFIKSIQKYSIKKHKKTKGSTKQ